MTVLQIVYLYLATVSVFFVIDLIWLGVIARGFYQDQIGFLLGPVNWVAAVIFYLIFIGGIILFAVLPAVEAGSFMRAVLLGAAFGFIAYATYDLTNLATVKDWPLTMTIVDIIWGTVLSTLVASASYYIATTFIV